MSQKLYKVLVLLFLFSIYLTSCNEDPEYWKSESRQQLISIVSASFSDRACQAYQIEGFYAEAKRDEDKKIHGYPIISGPLEMSPVDQKVLFSIIKNKSTYLDNAVPQDCFFQPGVAFQFNHQKRLVDLLVCFKCMELRYYLDGEIVWQTYFRDNGLEGLVRELFL